MYKDIDPRVYVRGMSCAHKRGEKIPAKSAQTGPSNCDHHMFTNCRVPVPWWKREETPDALASPLSRKGSPTGMANLPHRTHLRRPRDHDLKTGHTQEAAAQSMARFHPQRPPAGAAIAAVVHILNNSPTGSRPLTLHRSGNDGGHLCKQPPPITAAARVAATAANPSSAPRIRLWLAIGHLRFGL
jgi:hypothetical protein